MGTRGWGFHVAILLSCFAVFGQGTTSRLVGTVLDSSGAAVGGAAVTLTNEGTGATFNTQTSDTGTYVFEALQSGRYSVGVESKGFKKFISKSNEVNIGQPSTVNVTLEIGGVAEQIEVVASAEIVQTSTSGNFGNLFSEKTIKDLPIVGTRGRNPLDLVLLQPGVVSGSNTGGGLHVNGARDRAWNYTLDGIDTNETSAGGANLSPTRLNPDALAEFRVITTNATAEYGRSSGGQVSMITKSGTNEFHGKAFYFYRTPRFNANEWENNINARGQRQFVQHIPGGDFGGPIWKNHTFFYGNLQMLRARETQITDRTVLTQSARQGLLRYVIGGRNQPAGLTTSTVDTQGNVVPGVQIGSYNVATNDPQRLGLDRRIQGLVNEAPLPNNFNGGDGLNTAFYTFTAVQTEKQHDAMIRLDHILNAKNTLFGRVSWGAQDTICDRVNGGSELYPGRGCIVNTERAPNNMAYSWRWNPTPVVTNEFVFGRNRFTFAFVQPFGSLDEYALSAPIALVESTEFGNTRTLQTWQFVDNVAWQKGAHALKFGINFRFQKHFDERGSIASLNSAPLLNFSTTINTVDPATFGIPADLNTQFDRPNFQSWINLMLGRVGQRQQGFVAEGNSYRTGLFEFEAGFDEYDFYVQDTWKVRRNLTIDLGLRWEMKLTPTSPQDILAPDQLVAAGAPSSNTLRWTEKELFKSSWNNLGPSIGFAWDPTSAGKMSVRANYRIAYDRMPTFLPSSFVFPSIPGRTAGITDQEYGRVGGRLANIPKLTPPSGDPNSQLQPPPVSANSNTVFDPAFKMPTTHQWAASIQRQVGERSVLEVSYIGRRAYHLFGGYNANQAEIFRNGFVNEFNIVKNGGESALINRLTSADARLQAGETGSRMYRRLFLSDFTSNAVGALASRIATQQQGGRLVTELSGAGNFALIPYPQYTGGLFVIDSNDFSTYHAGQIQFERRFSGGLTAQASYVFSKSLDTRSFDPAFAIANTGTGQSAANTPFDINNRKLNYARSDFDRTHVVQSYFVWDMPFGKGKRFGSGAGRALDAVVGGWEMTGILRIQSGRPFSVFSGFNTFNSAATSMANCTGCSRSFGSVHDEGGLVWYFTPEERAKFSQPAAGEVGNTGRNYFDLPGSFNLDMSLLKHFSLTERLGLELRADSTNVTNTPTFGAPTTTLSSATFGRIRDTVTSFSRKVQLGAKITF